MRKTNPQNLIILLLLIFGFAVPVFSEAVECRLINILTDKTEASPDESIQVNVTAQKECIGQNVSIKICHSGEECQEVAAEIFSSRTVNGQQAINPVVISFIPSNFTNNNAVAFLQAVGPSNTIQSRNINITAKEKAKFGEYCTGTNNEECVDGLFCAGNACVECDVNGILSTCGSGQVCQDGACISDGEGDEDENGDGSESGVLGEFPGEDLEANDVINIVIGLSCWLTRVAFILTTIFVIFVGLKFMAAQGNQTKYGEAVTSFKHVVWGVLVIFGVYVIIATVANAVGVTDFSFIPLVC